MARALLDLVGALVLAILCLGLNAFFVAAEFALVKVHVTKIEPRARRGERRAIAAKRVLSKLDRYLSVTQFGITVASLGLGWIGEPAIERLGNDVSMRLTNAPLGPTAVFLVDALGLGVLTFFHLLLGELVPKFVAIRYSESTVLYSVFALRLVDVVFRPVLWILEKAQRAVLRVLGIDPDIVNEGVLSEDEIIGMLAASTVHGEVLSDKKRMIERVFRLSRKIVKHSMIPRVDVVAISIDASIEEARALLVKHEYSRIPLYKDSLDSVVGYLYAKDLWLAADSESRLEYGSTSRGTLHGFERRALFVQETRDELSVVREMQRERIPLAVVVDEYGGTSGIITLEDLIEDVFGEIRDELDEESEKIICVSAKPLVWDVAAEATMEELIEAGIPMESSGQDRPIGSIVTERLGRLPVVGDVVTLAEGLVARVSMANLRRVERVQIQASGALAAP